MKRALRDLGLLLLTAGWVLAACGRGAAEPQPPEIAYGEDVCEACGMIIDDARFAAASLTTDGRTHKFDDIGDMFAYQRAHPEEQVRAWFVHDYTSETWLRGEAAFYAVSSQVASPMGHGIAAFEDRAAAEAFARERNGEALAFDDLRAALASAAH